MLFRDVADLTRVECTNILLRKVMKIIFEIMLAGDESSIYRVQIKTLKTFQGNELERGYPLTCLYLDITKRKDFPHYDSSLTQHLVCRGIL